MKIIYIDVETTGIGIPESGLVQLAGEVEIDGEAKEQFSYRIRPFANDVVSDEALEVNGLTRAQLAQYPAPAEVFSEFEALLGKYIDRYDRTDKFLLVAYNAPFDADHLRAWFEKNQDRFFGSWFWHPPLDVMTLAATVLMAKRKELPNFKLTTVAAACGLCVDESKAHDALYDVLLTKELFRRIVTHVATI